MAYLSEIKSEWRALAGATIGMAAGIGYVTQASSICTPEMIAEFGWTKSQFALTQTLVLVGLISMPIIGRLTDVIGVKRTASIGIVAVPASCVALSMMTGDISHYLTLFVLQAVLGATTSAVVYSRIIVEYFRKARGFALALGACGPAIAGLLLNGLFNEYVDAEGWRSGYHLLAGFTLVMGIIALLVMPNRRRRTSDEPAVVQRPNKEVIAAIVGMPVFWLLMVAILIANLPLNLANHQLKLIMLENGMSGTSISVIFSAFSAGTLIGRLACGLALDRFPMHIVSAIGLGMPTIGLLLIASPFDSAWLLTLAVFLFGLSYGAESDILAYVSARVFGISVFSTVQGLFNTMVSVSLAGGAALLSLTLRLTGTFDLYLCIAAGGALVGSLLFLMLGRREKRAGAEGRILAPAFD